MPTLFRYEQYRKLKEEIREIEVQIFGSVFQKKFISIGCQPSEDFGFVSQTSEFSKSLKRNIDGSSCQQDSKRTSSFKAENIDSSDKTQQTNNLNTPNENGYQIRPYSWSGLKTESLYTDFGLVDYKNVRSVSGPSLTTDSSGCKQRHNTCTVSDDAVISQTSF